MTTDEMKKALDILERALLDCTRQGLDGDTVAIAVLNLYLAARLSVPLPKILAEVTETAQIFRAEFPGCMTEAASTPTGVVGKG